MTTQQTQILKKWLKQYDHLAEQGSQKWRDDRVESIGGSELHELLRNESAIVASKIGLRPFLELLPMVWGSVFEPIIRNIIMCLLKTTIHERGSIPSAEVKGKTFSMDGIGIVRFLCDRWDDVHKEFFMYLITLFEFKCPWSRMLVQGEIPKDYIPQVKSGMADLQIPDLALYTEGVFRICEFSDLVVGNKNINTQIHKPTDQMPMVMGYMGLYMEELVEPGEEFKWAFKSLCDSAPYDYGSVDSHTKLHDLLKLIKAKIVKVFHSPILATVEQSRIQYLKGQKIPGIETKVDFAASIVSYEKWVDSKKYFNIGLLPWKLIDLNIKPIEKETGYTKKYEPEIHHCIKVVRELRDIKDLNDRIARYSEIYGLDLVTNDNGASTELDNYIL